MAHGGADAVSAGIAPADHYDIFALGRNVSAVLVAIEKGLGVRVEELHGEVDAWQIAAFDRKIARLGRSGAKNNGVEFCEQPVGGKILSYFGIRGEDNSFLAHQINAALHDTFFVELHVGNAIHEQSSDSIRTLEHRH